MKLIGTPFNGPKQIEVDHLGCIDPYNTAKKNKIELLFVESLSKYQSLPKELVDELNKQREVHKVLQGIASKITEILNAVEYKYAIIKVIIHSQWRLIITMYWSLVTARIIEMS
jgi:hypothetical protein